MISGVRSRRLAFAGVLAIVLLSASVIEASDLHGYVPGRFIVTVRSLGRLAEIRSALASSDVFEPIIPIAIKPALNDEGAFERIFIYHSTDSLATPADVVRTLGAANVVRVEQDQYLDFYDYPADPLFSHQWYLHNTGQGYFGIQRVDGYYNDVLVTKYGTPGADVNISPYYESAPAETTSVVVGVVDTGTDPNHPDLQGRFWKNPDEIPGNGIDDDHNGFVDDTLGYDVSGDTPAYYNIVGDNDPTDANGHGTHLAGIVAANANGIGIAGVAPWAQIMSVKIRPNGFLSVGTAGVLYAVNNGARVINISWGTPFEALVLKEALNLARRNGVFVSIAAGNTGDNTRANPAAFDSSFTVAAGNSAGKMASFSTWGPFIDLVAPGQDMLSLRAAGTDMYAEAREPNVRIIDNYYYLADGTSMAAPVVAGAAALMLSFRPDLNLQQLENILRMGAMDMVDPLSRGDSLVGPDSISGYGYLDIHHSLDLLVHGGLAFAEPVPFSRYAGALPIRAYAVAGYSGGWHLEYSVGTIDGSWTALAEGLSVPSDSLLYTFNHPELSGLVNFRLTDDFGTHRVITIRYVDGDRLQISTPHNGDTVEYSISIKGSACGINYDSVTVRARFENGPAFWLKTSTAEYMDTLIFFWNASGLDAGAYTILLTGYFHGETRIDSSKIMIASSFAAGWPQALPSRGAQTVVTCDLNHDGVREVVAGTFNGLYVFTENGQPVNGFPRFPDSDMRSVPAIYDVDSDGQDEIICTGEDSIHVFKYDGSEAAGWPRKCTTGKLVLGYPSPTVATLTIGQAPVIMIVNTEGTIYAYHLNGDPYFYSLGGKFAGFNTGVSTGYFFGGNSVTAADLTGDNKPKVIVSYSGLTPRSGVAVFDGRSGQPAFGRSIPQVIEGQLVYGTVLADLNNDHLPEIITTGQDSAYNRILWVKTTTPNGRDLQDLPGFPVRFPDASGWIGNCPAIADLDLDGVPEIVCTFYEYDVGAVYAIRADGTAYIDSVPGQPYGQMLRVPNTLGVPAVANLTGDRHPEIVVRGGYILPGTGSEVLYLLDYQGTQLPMSPVVTPAQISLVFSNSYAPMIDDIDGDSLVELAYMGDAGEVYVWNYDASSKGGANTSRFLADNRNSSYFFASGVPTDIPDNPPSLPVTFRLDQNYPNPFNPATTIPFTLPSRARARMELYNVLGQRVGTILDADVSAGAHTVQFDGSSLSSGVYFYRLTAGNYQQARKMVLLK